MSRQFKIALAIELLILMSLWTFGFMVWRFVCDDTAAACFREDNIWNEIGFLVLSIVRPFFFSPLMQTAYIGGSSFGIWMGTLLTAFGAALSALAVYYPGHIIGKKIVRPWLSANLPSTWRLIRTQDYKIIFFTRWIPFFPFDLMSLVYGVADFHARRVLLFTFLGCLPEVFFFTSLGGPLSPEIVIRGLKNLAIFGSVTLVPLLAYEYFHRKRGGNLWISMKRVYYELLYEARVNNEIVKKNRYSADKIPIVLLYGFGSSRKTLRSLETVLTKRGFEVMSFNLGGSLGVFFTRGIKDTAEFIDRKIQRQMRRYGFKKVHVVAHSKGGLVALWWLLRLGGSEYCDKIITMGTPFKGSWLTWLALVTPLSFFWKDVWQMRPGSSFLRELHQSRPVPGLKIYNLYSERDKIAKGDGGVFVHAGEVVKIPMHHVNHFGFLGRRDVVNVISRILRRDQGTGRARRIRDEKDINASENDHDGDGDKEQGSGKQFGSQKGAV